MHKLSLSVKVWNILALIENCSIVRGWLNLARFLRLFQMTVDWMEIGPKTEIYLTIWIICPPALHDPAGQTIRIWIWDLVCNGFISSPLPERGFLESWPVVWYLLMTNVRSSVCWRVLVGVGYWDVAGPTLTVSRRSVHRCSSGGGAVWCGGGGGGGGLYISVIHVQWSC